MTNKSVDVLLPTGRLIRGSLYNPKKTDLEGRPLVFKNGADAGKPYCDYFLSLAIPKTPGIAHWKDEVSTNPRVGTWGAKLYNAAKSFWGETIDRPTGFAWKIIDGDSEAYDGSVKPKRHCDKPNFRGNWIINMGSLSVPRIMDAKGDQYLTMPDEVKCGYWVQIYASIRSNNSEKKPGVFINHKIVSLQRKDVEIIESIDPLTVGFGDGTAPEQFEQAAPPTVAPPAPPVVPNHRFVDQAGLPPPPPSVAAPPAPPAPPAPRLLKNGQSYDAYIANGWSEAQLVSEGLL